MNVACRCRVCAPVSNRRDSVCLLSRRRLNLFAGLLRSWNCPQRLAQEINAIRQLIEVEWILSEHCIAGSDDSRSLVSDVVDVSSRFAGCLHAFIHISAGTGEAAFGHRLQFGEFTLFCIKLSRSTNHTSAEFSAFAQVDLK